ncbi:MAG: DUF4258 domain-containing protein [Chryseobacterium sp.]|nr:DUF4258 domain-containing protein [Chryseobacterium sp.]
MKKLKFYMIGFIPGILFVLFIFGKKDASCSYFPSARVKAETLTKTFEFTADFKQEMGAQKLTEKFLRDSIFENGKIDFDRSNAQEKPCPHYLILYPTKNPKYEIEFDKCKETSTFTSLKTLR